jgi:site-specific recombinase XerD
MDTGPRINPASIPNDSTVSWRGSLERLEGAYSENTLRSYRSDFARFEAWCETTGAAALPSTPEVIAAFIANDALTAASSTLKRRLCAIRKIHRLLRMPNPVEDEEVATALRRAMRTKRRRPKQALGLTAKLRDQLIAACPDTLRGFRDRAMIAVGYDSLCRRSELVNLLIEDLALLDDGGAKLMVRRAKNDPFGDGRWAHLSPPAVRHVQAWLDKAGLTDGPMFRGVAGPRVLDRPLQPIAVNRTLKLASDRAGISAWTTQALSGHSMRVGAAQDLMAAGRGLLQIMTAGGWTSVNVVGRYVREADVNVWAEPR